MVSESDDQWEELSESDNNAESDDNDIEGDDDVDMSD